MSFHATIKVVATRILVAMSTSPASESPVNQVQKWLRRTILFFVLGVPLAFVSGTVVAEPASAAILTGVLTSFAFGVFVVAPHAGRLAKRHFLRSLAHPTEEDTELLTRGVFNIVDRMAFMAQDDELKKAFGPIFAAYSEALDARYKALVSNVASQRERGAGAFNPESYSEEEIGLAFRDEIMGMAGGVVDPLLESIGATDRGKSIVHAKMMLALEGRGPGNGGRQSAPRGAHRGGGIDFRRG